MRNAFAAEITALASENKQIVLLSGDIGNRLFDNYKAHFEDRFFNCGVAEANMIGVAAGMAMSGLRPVTYTIASFATARCLEQIRVDVCYHNLPVTIVGVGAGLSYASAGATHQSCEDIAMLRILPNMTVICPGDALEVRQAIRAASEHNGPVYVRLGKKGEPDVHSQSPDFKIGKGIVVRDGSDICLLSVGNMLPTSVYTAQELEKKGISARVVSFHTIKPLDQDLLEKAFAKFKLVLSIEEHTVLGGLGSSIAEWLVANPTSAAKFLPIGTPDKYYHKAGDQAYVREQFGLTERAIIKRILEKLTE